MKTAVWFFNQPVKTSTRFFGRLVPGKSHVWHLRSNNRSCCYLLRRF